MDKNAVRLAAWIKKTAGGSSSGGGMGLRIVSVLTTNPDTFMFEGTQLAIDAEIFEVAKHLRPLAVGEKLMALPLVTQDNSQRWGLIGKLE